MIIGYSEQTLWNNIAKQLSEIQSEHDWAVAYHNGVIHYRCQKDVECLEDCARNIMDSCSAILENIKHLKGEEL